MISLHVYRPCHILYSCKFPKQQELLCAGMNNTKEIHITGGDGSISILMAEAMEAQLAACVRQSLEAFLYQNAVFMCERLYAEFHTEVRRFLTSMEK